jgi:WD40 repeat protein
VKFHEDTVIQRRYGSSHKQFDAHQPKKCIKRSFPGMWDLAAGKLRRTLKGHKGEVTPVAFSKDGRWIATGGRNSKERNHEVVLWDAKNGEMKQTVAGLSKLIHAVAFSGDGKTLVVCAGQGTGEGNNVTTTGEIRSLSLQ